MTTAQRCTGKDNRPPSARTPEGLRLYAVGDVHGRADLLEDIHGMIRADAKTAADCKKTIIYLGDYIDRGEMSFEVIETLISNPLDGFNTVHLKGNHEYMMLDFLAPDGQLERWDWLINGGKQTLLSYGLDPSTIADLGKTREMLENAMPESHKKFFANLALCHIEGDYLFVHAGIKPGTDIEDQSEDAMLWIRGEFLNCPDDFGKTVVHGHSVRPVPDIRTNRIGIDTGACYTGHLTCLVAEGGNFHFLHT